MSFIFADGMKITRSAALKRNPHTFPAPRVSTNAARAAVRPVSAHHRKLAENTNASNLFSFLNKNITIEYRII